MKRICQDFNEAHLTCVSACSFRSLCNPRGSVIKVFVISSRRILPHNGRFVRGFAHPDRMRSRNLHSVSTAALFSKLSGHMATKEVHPCFTLHSIESSHSYISSSGLKVSKWHTHHGRAIHLAPEKTQMFYCFSLSEDKAKSAWIESSWNKEGRLTKKILHVTFILWAACFKILTAVSGSSSQTQKEEIINNWLHIESCERNGEFDKNLCSVQTLWWSAAGTLRQ